MALSKLVLETDNWTYADFVAYTKAHEEHNFDSLAELCSELIVEWDNPTLDPRDPASYEELDFPTMLGVFKTVSKTIQEMFKQEKGKNDKTLATFDFKRWKYRDFMRLQEAQEANDVDTVKELIFKALESWQYRYDGTSNTPIIDLNPDNLEELRLSDYIDLMNTLVKEIKAIGGEGN